MYNLGKGCVQARLYAYRAGISNVRPPAPPIEPRWSLPTVCAIPLYPHSNPDLVTQP